jgi:hypothetical protein
MCCLVTSSSPPTGPGPDRYVLTGPRERRPRRRTARPRCRLDGHHRPGYLGMAHPVRQRGGILAGPHRGHAESHHRPCPSLAGGGRQGIAVGGAHDHPSLVEDQDRPNPWASSRRRASPAGVPSAAVATPRRVTSPASLAVPRTAGRRRSSRSCTRHSHAPGRTRPLRAATRLAGSCLKANHGIHDDRPPHTPRPCQCPGAARSRSHDVLNAVADEPPVHRGGW